MDINPSNRAPRGLLALCVVLWVTGVLFVLYAAWLALDSVGLAAFLPLVVGLAALASGWGLYRQRRWGVVLFGGLALAGSINHLSGVIFRFPDISTASTAAAVGAIISVLGGILIPFALIYLTLMLWRQAR